MERSGVSRRALGALALGDRRHLEAVLAAREAGCDMRGYFEWTLSTISNGTWATPRNSAWWPWT